MFSKRCQTMLIKHAPKDLRRLVKGVGVMDYFSEDDVLEWYKEHKIITVECVGAQSYISRSNGPRGCQISLHPPALVEVYWDVADDNTMWSKHTEISTTFDDVPTLHLEFRRTSAMKKKMPELF